MHPHTDSKTEMERKPSPELLRNGSAETRLKMALGFWSCCVCPAPMAFTGVQTGNLRDRQQEKKKRFSDRAAQNNRNRTL